MKIRICEFFNCVFIKYKQKGPRKCQEHTKHHLGINDRLAKENTSTSQK